MSEEHAKIGVLSFHNSKETKSILNCIERMGHEPVWLRQRNMSISMDENGLSISPTVDLVMNRMLPSTSHKPLELLCIADAVQQSVPMMNRPESVLSATNKISATSKMSKIPTDIGIPNSLFSSSDDMEEFIEENNGGVLKRAISTHGDGVGLLEPEDSVLSEVQHNFSFVQELINQNNPSDVRVYVVDGEVVGVMQRRSPEGDWRSNIARGGSATTYDLDESVQSDVIKIVDFFGLDYAGVDLMSSDDGFIFLEINPTAGFKGLFNATGRNPAPYICRCAIDRLGFNVSDERVYEESKILDDSVPMCKPFKTIGKKPVLGMREEIVVEGPSGRMTLEAKIDTGADRTCVDTKVSSELGLGPIRDYCEVRNGTSGETVTRPVAELKLSVAGIEHKVNASIDDRSEMSSDILLGRDVLTSYKIDPTKGRDDTVES